MPDVDSTSKVWSVVGVALPALATVFAAIAALKTEQRAINIALMVICLIMTVLAIQRVYACSEQSSHRMVKVPPPSKTQTRMTYKRESCRFVS